MSLISESDMEALAALYEEKDFKRAAKRLSVSESALKTRISSIEERAGISIVTSAKEEGAIFTNAGKSLAEDFAFVIRYIISAMEKARMIEAEDESRIRIGMSTFSPRKEFESALATLKDRLFPLSCQTVHFYSMEETLRNLESHVDVLTSFYDDRLLKKYSLSAIEMRKEKLMVAMRKDCQLAEIPLLDMEDLYGKRLYIQKKGYLRSFDQLRSDIAEYHGEIDVITFDSYSEALEEKVEREDALLISFQALEENLAHLTLKPVLWNYSSSFGILYKKEPKSKVASLITLLKESGKM